MSYKKRIYCYLNCPYYYHSKNFHITPNYILNFLMNNILRTIYFHFQSHYNLKHFYFIICFLIFIIIYRLLSYIIFFHQNTQKGVTNLVIRKIYLFQYSIIDKIKPYILKKNISKA